jgi:hypothetical protein
MAKAWDVSAGVSPLLYVLASQCKVRKLSGDLRELSCTTTRASHFENLYEIEKPQRTDSKSRREITGYAPAPGRFGLRSDHQAITRDSLNADISLENERSKHVVTH